MPAYVPSDDDFALRFAYDCGEFGLPMAQENSELKPDICVIGAGAGGLAAAAAAAAMGVPVVLIEKGRMGGQSL